MRRPPSAARAPSDSRLRSLLLRLAWVLYGLAAELAVWLVLVPVQLARVALGRSSLAELAERLGLTALDRPRLLVHAVSVGEVAAAGALLSELARHGTFPSLLTCGNRDGHRAAARLRGQGAADRVAFLPWDRPRAMRRWLARLSPGAVVVIETELWPGLFRACRERSIPLLLVSARLYPADVRRYRRARAFFADVLSAPLWIGVQDAAQREAFLAIGAPPERVEVMGNLKLDVRPEAGELPAPWAARLGRGPLLVAGSTHPGEEGLLLNAFRSLRREHPALRLVLAPRHVGRGAAVTRLARRAGHAVARLTEAASAGTAWDILVLDEIGSLPAFYALADIAFVGGSLVRRGGQNPLEPAAAGKATVMGPRVEHFQSLVDSLDTAGGIVRLAGPEELEPALSRLLGDEAERARLGERARRFCQAGGGVARRPAALLTELLPASSAPRDSAAGGSGRR